MILPIFIFLLFLALTLIGIGFYWGADAFMITGFTFIFILGVVMLTGGLEYETSIAIVTVGATATVTPQYTTFDNHTISFLFTIMGIVGFIFTLTDRRRNYDE